MIAAVNALIECFVTGLFTAAILVVCTKQGWFPVVIMQVMTQDELDEMNKKDDGDYDE